MTTATVCQSCGTAIPAAITYEEHTGTAAHRAAIAAAVGRTGREEPAAPRGISIQLTDEQARELYSELDYRISQRGIWSRHTAPAWVVDLRDRLGAKLSGTPATAHAFQPGTSDPTARCPRCHRTAAEAWAGRPCDPGPSQ